MTYYFDIDNTITETDGIDYKNARPKLDIIRKINKIYNNGHTVIYWTSRGVGSGIDLKEMTEAQLNKWGAQYHGLRMDKPLYDRFYDDKCYNAQELVNADTLH